MEAATHRHPRCHICQVELPWHRSLVLIAHRIFCATHARQYHTRQRQGVATEELETRWSDTLDNWRERPRALDQECGARWGLFNYLFFSQRVEGWVLFLRSAHYWAWQRLDFRGPDTVAVHLETGEIRRFVSVGPEEVLEDLRGIRPAPYQAELRPYWGRRLPPGFYKRLAQPYLDERGRLRVLALLQVASFPIYGFVGHPLGLTVCGAGTQGAGFRLSSVSFRFSSSRYPRVREAVSIGSAENRHPEQLGSQRPDSWLFEHYRLSALERAQAGEPTIEQAALTIAQVPFTGERFFWAQPYPLSWFHLTSAQTRLVGSALGPSEEEVLHLLEALVVLNQRADLGAEYQLELDQERARFARGYGARRESEGG